MELKNDKIITTDYKKTYESNIYIMLPYFFLKDMDLKNIGEQDNIAEGFIKLINDEALYESNNDVVNDLKRYFLGKKQLYCFDDEYDGTVKDKEEVYMFLTVHNNTKLCLLNLMIIKNKYSTTQIQDQVSSNNLYIDYNDDQILLDDYMEKYYNLYRCGDAKVLVSASAKPEDDLEFKYMLASEVYGSSQYNHVLVSEEINIKTKENFAQYDFYDIYATREAIIYILKNFDKNELLNIQSEVSILFIMELIMFQQAAIFRTNQRITNELANNGAVSLTKIENLYIEFGKTIKFWGRNMFKYYASQYLADKINDAFETKKQLEDYYQNQKFLEHIVSLKDVQSSNKENRILNIVVIILTIMQVIPTIINIIDWLNASELNNFDFSSMHFWGIGSVFIIFVILIIKRSINKKKKNRL